LTPVSGLDALSYFFLRPSSLTMKNRSLSPPKCRLPFLLEIKPSRCVHLCSINVFFFRLLPPPYSVRPALASICLMEAHQSSLKAACSPSHMTLFESILRWLHSFFVLLFHPFPSLTPYGYADGSMYRRCEFSRFFSPFSEFWARTPF